MNHTTKALSSFGALLFLVACTSSSTSSPPPTSPDPTDNDGDTTKTVVEGLSFVEPCSASTCGEVPGSSQSTRPECRAASGTCTWTDPSPDTAVSYRQCEESECGGTKPDESVCPAGTTYEGSDCGSENEGPCAWRSTCVPPRSTIPCDEADACGPKPEIGVVCKDGTTGDLLCMKQGNSCRWQSSCE